MTTQSSSASPSSAPAPGTFANLPGAPSMDFSTTGHDERPTGTGKPPLARASTTTPLNTYAPVQVDPSGSVVLYWPEKNGFVALTLDEWVKARTQAQEHVDVIQNLQDANKAVTAAATALRDRQKARASKSELDQANEALEQALNKVAEASEAAKKKVEPLAPIDAKEGEKMIEMLPLTPKRWLKKDMVDTPIYIRASAIKTAMDDRRIYLVDGEAEKRKYPKDKLIKNGSLDTGELKKRMAQKVQDSAAFKGKLWAWPSGTEKEVSGLLFESWSKKMGADATSFLERTAKELESHYLKSTAYSKDNPHRIIDIKPEAQFMRWSAGAGIEANFNPIQGNLFDRRDNTTKAHLERGFKEGQLGIKGSAHADFNIAEAKVPTTLYLPHFAGWHVSPEILGNQFDLGFYRFLVELDLYGAAGASIALECDIALTYAAGTQGLRKSRTEGRTSRQGNDDSRGDASSGNASVKAQGIKGSPSRKKGGVKLQAGAGAELQAFAGIKAGIDLKGNFQWLNPEGYLDLTALSRLKPTDAIAEYCDIAKVDTGIAAELGAGAGAALTIKHENGKFVLRVKGSLCIGLGGDGHFKFEVDTKTITAFFKFVAYTLKHNDWAKMSDFMVKEAFDAFNHILVMVIAKKEALEKYAHAESEAIRRQYRALVSELQSNGQQYLDAIHDTLKDWGIVAYLPPESRGAIVALVNEAMSNPNVASDPTNRDKAAFVVAEIMATQQTSRQLAENLARITPNIGEKTEVAMGEVTIRTLTDGTAYTGCLDRCRIAITNAHPTLGKPFLRNDEPTFIAATFPVSDPVYGIG